MNKKGLTINELDQLLSYWQKRLLLDNWKLSIEITEFNRTDFKQSGNVKVFPEDRKAVILLTNNPFKNEEYVLVHELIHLILWDLDTFSEKFILEKIEYKLKGDHGKYMQKLEKTVDRLTKAFIKAKNGNE